MQTFWADVTVKVQADTLDEADAILYDSVYQMTSIYDDQIKIVGIEVDAEKA